MFYFIIFQGGARSGFLLLGVCETLQQSHFEQQQYNTAWSAFITPVMLVSFSVVFGL
jgi:hypothetical protein